MHMSCDAFVVARDDAIQSERRRADVAIHELAKSKWKFVGHDRTIDVSSEIKAFERNSENVKTKSQRSRDTQKHESVP